MTNIFYLFVLGWQILKDFVECFPFQSVFYFCVFFDFFLLQMFFKIAFLLYPFLAATRALPFSVWLHQIVSCFDSRTCVYVRLRKEATEEDPKLAACLVSFSFPGLCKPAIHPISLSPTPPSLSSQTCRHAYIIVKKRFLFLFQG